MRKLKPCTQGGNVKTVLKSLSKARLVALGNCESGLADLRPGAPTLSELSTHLILQYAASWGADLVQGDVKQAFLNGEKISRKIYLELPRDLPGGLPVVVPGSLIVPTTSISDWPMPPASGGRR